MDRQLFSHGSRVSSDRRQAGVMPVSMALHIAAIAAALVLSGMKPRSVPEAPKPPLTYRPDPATPVRVNVLPPSGPRAFSSRPRTSAPRGSSLPGPAATPLVAPREVPERVPEPPTADDEPRTGGSDVTSLDPGPGCPTCTGDRPGPASDRHGADSGEGDRPIRVATGSIEAPRRLNEIALRYPPIAVSIGLSGDVLIDCVIGPDGGVRDARVLSGSPVLQRAALDAVRQWRYTEPKLNGRPISVLLAVTVHFRLQR
jgi:protein TonB